MQNVKQIILDSKSLISFSPLSANTVWICLLLVPFFMALLFLYLPIQYFALIASFLIVVGLSLNKPELGIYVIVPLVVLFSDTTGFYYRLTLFNSRDLSLLVPIFSVFILIECYILFIHKSIHKTANIDISKKLVMFNVFFLVINLFGIYWLYNPTSPIIFIRLFFNVLLFHYVLAICSLDPKNIDKIITVFIISGFLSSAAVVYSILVHPDYTYYEKLLSKFSFISTWSPGVSVNRGYALELSNFAARTLNLVMTLIVGRLFVSSGQIRSILLWSALFFAFFAQCLTASKGGLIAFLAVSGFFIIFHNKLRKNFIRNCIIYLCSIAFIYILAIIFINCWGVGEAFRQTNVDLSSKSVSFETRLEYWGTGFQAMAKKDAFITGLGLGGYQYFGKINVWPHNTYLSFYFEMGLLGIIFLTIMFVHVTTSTFKLKLLFHQNSYHRQIAFVLLGGFIVIATHSLIDFYFNNPIHWLYMALLFVSLSYAAKDKLQPDNI